LSYFAKPNFLVYDEWFDDDLEKTKIDLKNKKINPISTIHEFFYEQSNFKVGASENNLTLDIKANQKELITNNYLLNIAENFTSVSNKQFSFFKKRTSSKLKFGTKKQIIYSLSIFSLLILFGFAIFLISSSRKNESKISNIPLKLEKILF